MAARGRGRPRIDVSGEDVADAVAAQIIASQVHVLQGKTKAKGQRRIGLQLSTIYCSVAEKFGISASTVEKYFREHQHEINARWVAGFDARSDKDDATPSARTAKVAVSKGSAIMSTLQQIHGKPKA